MKTYSLIFLFALSIFAFAQDDLRVGLYGGPDFSLLAPPADSILVESMITPFFGLEMLYPLQKNNHIRFGGFYSMKSSKSLNNIKYRNNFISVYANYHYNISKSFFLTIGPQYSVLLSANSLNGAIKESIPGYDSYMSVNAGIDFQLQSHLNLGVIYEYPITNSKLATWPSIKVKLSLIIDKQLFKIDKKVSNKEYSKVKLQELKRTALLVRLRGYKKQIDAYSERGDTAMVKLMKQKRDEHNQSIIDAFATEFDFCPVYFFYNFDTKKIKDKDFKNVFVNKSLEIDGTIEFDLDTFLIGELGYTLTDTMLSPSHVDRYKNRHNMSEGYVSYDQVESDIGHYGFNIRNQDFVFLDKPFPGFISGYFAFLRRSDDVVIKKLNIELYKFNEKSGY